MELLKKIMQANGILKSLPVNEKAKEEMKRQIEAYIDELSTKQNLSVLEKIKSPVELVLRKVDIRVEKINEVKALNEKSNILYASSHKSYLDPIILSYALGVNGLEIPRIIAGKNLFNGLWGLVQRNIFGAIPIERGNNDPVYLTVFKEYISEALKETDLLFFIEGGRSYDGKLKTAKLGVLKAAMKSEGNDVCIVPVSISYDRVLEDKVLSSRTVKKKQRRFTKEFFEMIYYAFFYETRVFISFGKAVHFSEFENSSKDFLLLKNYIMSEIQKNQKILPTSIFAKALGEFDSAAKKEDIEKRIISIVGDIEKKGYNIFVKNPETIIRDALDYFKRGNIIKTCNGTYCARNKSVINYYGNFIGL